ncbi:hypothetical protein M885DRAFT_613252 [Pelagophyceae sp. CCMP2097]|nr:hypothetical protein M885DRAFT_613252 [Pelagophyceae sp. CCMP2097]
MSTMTSTLQPVGVQACSFLPTKPTKMRRARETRTAAGAKPGASTSATPPDRRQLCEAMLQDGFVQSFVDFFYLTHRPDPLLMEQRLGTESEGAAGAVRDIAVPAGEMAFIRDNLAKAEAARRKGETALVYGSFSHLARYFQKQPGDAKTGIYFYEKCHEIARLTGDHRGEMAANHDLGLAHAHVGDVAGATRYHERHLDMARALDDAAEVAGASRELVAVYRAAADAHEARGDAAAAAEAHARCLDAARRAGDAPAEARAALALGRALVLRGVDFAADACEALDGAALLCRALGDAEGEGRACAALAAAWRARGDAGRAEAYLDDCLEHARAARDVGAQAAACRTLGALHAAKRDFATAEAFLRRDFDLTRQLFNDGQADAAAVDRARVDLGIAIANAQLGTYLRALNTDFPALLAWKNSREPLPTDDTQDDEDSR